VNSKPYIEVVNPCIYIRLIIIYNKNIVVRS